MRGKLRRKVENDEIMRDICRRDSIARTVMGSESNLHGKLCTFGVLIPRDTRGAVSRALLRIFRSTAATIARASSRPRISDQERISVLLSSFRARSDINAEIATNAN
jgi:hypothetical protein